MRRYIGALCAVLLLSGSGCSDNGRDKGADQATEQNSAEAGADSQSPALTVPAEPDKPEYQELTERQLRAALLTIDDLPPGYSADPPDEGESIAKYCGAKPDKAPTRVGQDFTKGGGFTVELSSVGLSQYPSAEIASSNLERLRQGLATCPGETVEGEKVTYAVMSTPKLEHPTLGIRVSAENYRCDSRSCSTPPTRPAGRCRQRGVDYARASIELAIRSRSLSARRRKSCFWVVTS